MEIIGIISEYDFDLIELLRSLNFEFYYFVIDSEEYRRVENVTLIPFEELEKYYEKPDFILNFSDIEMSLEKVINTIYDLKNVDSSRVYVYRLEKPNLNNVIYFPFVVDVSNIKSFYLEKLFKLKNKFSVFIICDKIDINILGVLSLLSNEFEIFVYGILEKNITNINKNAYILGRKLDRSELLKIISYVDIILDFSERRFFKELIIAAYLKKPILTIKNFRNFPKLILDEKIKERILSHLKKKSKLEYDIDEFLLENAKGIVEYELRRLLQRNINI